MESFYRFSIILLVVCLLGSTHDWAEATLISNPSFETPETTGGVLPTTFGDWSGDLSQIVTAENGIVPFDGSRMLRFDGTFLNTSIDGFASDVWQLIDMSPFSTVVSTGLALASGSI